MLKHKYLVIWKLLWLIYITRFGYTDSDPNPDCKPNGYIVLCINFHNAQNQIQIPIVTANYRNGIRIRIRIGIWLGGGSRISQTGAPIPGRGTNILFGRMCVENCMKMKKMDQEEEGTYLEALLRSANADQLNVNKPLRRETN